MEDTSPLSPASAVPQMRFGKIDDLISRVAAAIDGARSSLFSEQHEEGYWCGELEADATLEADYIILHVLLGTGNPERMMRRSSEISSSFHDLRALADSFSPVPSRTTISPS